MFLALIGNVKFMTHIKCLPTWKSCLNHEAHTIYENFKLREPTDLMNAKTHRPTTEVTHSTRQFFGQKIGLLEHNSGKF